MLGRLRSRFRGVVGSVVVGLRRVRTPQAAMMAAAFALIAGLYCTNQDMGGDPVSPRGDGKYRPVLARGDGHMLYLMARSTVFDRDWNFDNDLARFGDPWNQARTATGRKAIGHPIGPALVWAPMLVVAHAGAIIGNAFGAGIQTHGYTLWHQRIVFALSVVFACGAALLGWRVAARWVGGRWAPTYAAVAVLLGTSLAYYATFMPSYGHAMDAFFSGAFLAYWALTIGRDDLRRYVALGGLLGLATLVRPQELALGVVLMVEVAGRVLDRFRPRRGEAGAGARQRLWWSAGQLGRGALSLVVALIVLVPQLIEWRIVFGGFWPHAPGYTRPGAAMPIEMLFSARNGWFSTTPIAYAGAVGLLLLPRRARLVAAGFLAAVVLQIYLNSIIFDWWASASFGQRRLCNVTLPLVVGLAALLSALGRLAARGRMPRSLGHGLVIVVLGWFVVWNLGSVWLLRGGKPANAQLRASCCREGPRPLRSVAQPIYDLVGNPFALPASAVFAWRHGVPLVRWDQAVGDYVLVPPLDSLDGTFRRLRATWAIGAGADRFLLGGFGPTQKADRPYRWTVAARAEALVPLLMPDGQRFAVWLHPGGAHRVVVRWNGRQVADVELPDGWSQVGFDLRDPGIGSNVVTIEATPGPVIGPLPPPPGGVAGVAVGDLEDSFLAP